jgi:hypothetical protein
MCLHGKSHQGSKSGKHQADERQLSGESAKHSVFPFCHVPFLEATLDNAGVWHSI